MPMFLALCILPSYDSKVNFSTPDKMKLHLFGSQIPYTLTINTMRNVEPSTSSQHQKSLFGDQNSASGTGNISSNPLRPLSTRSSETKKHRKSLDLVYRRRLPSQDSFSSQDHSISPRTPDNTSNVAEYIMRRRSLSSDRAANAPQPFSTPPLGNSWRDDRAPGRRPIQPVKMDNALNLAPEPSKTSDPKQNDQEQCKGEPKSGLKPESEEMSNDEKKDLVSSLSDALTNLSDTLPPPPDLSITQLEISTSEKKESAETILAEKIISGVLETDF
jgi:hypothetical protein